MHQQIDMNFSQQKATNREHLISKFAKTLYSRPLGAQNLAGHIGMLMEPNNHRNQAIINLFLHIKANIAKMAKTRLYAVFK